MYKQVMIPNERNNSITIPKEWYGMRVEIIATPVVSLRKEGKDNDIPPVKTMYAQYLASLSPEERENVLEQKKKLSEMFSKCPVDLSNFKFNRDEANDYD
jgi:hypothetical protein